MRARRDAAIRLLKTMMGASVVIPVAIFCYASWVAHQNAYTHADERLWASLGIMSEHTSRIFQSVDLTFTSVDAIAGDLTDEEIKAAEPALHAKLSKLEKATGAVDAILIADKDGHTLVSSALSPVPPTAVVADRDYFRAQKDRDAGTFIGGVLQPRLRKGEFFGVSRRRPSKNGEFTGVIMVAVQPKVFTDFYAQLARDAGGGGFSLARADGAILARYPAAPEGVNRFGPESGFMRNVSKYPVGAIITTGHSIEGVERRIAFRPLGFGNLYVSDGMGTDAIIDDWLRTITAHLYFGLPAVLVLIVLVLMTMQRTREFYNEAERREAAEQALRQAQKMEAVGQLTGGVAHDFNNLLTIIIGNLGIARRGVVEARAERALDNALAGAERAAQLTQRLLAFSRRQPLDPRALDVNKLIVGMSDLLNRTLGENIALETISGAGLWTVEADAPELETALLNLALNARDAMPDGGKLTIETSNAYLDDDYAAVHAGIKPGQYVLIAVSRHRRRHVGGDDRARLRSVLHHQGDGQRHRPGPEPGLWLRQAVGRARQDLQRGRRRHDRQALSAAASTAKNRCRRRRSRPAPSAAAAKPFWWSRTTTACGNMPPKSCAT